MEVCNLKALSATVRLLRGIVEADGLILTPDQNIAKYFDHDLYEADHVNPFHAEYLTRDKLFRFLFLITNIYYVLCEVLKVVNMKSTIFLNVTPYSPAEVANVSEEYTASIVGVHNYAKKECSKKQAERSATWSLLHVGCFLGLFFDREDGRSNFIRNVVELLPDYVASRPKIQCSSLKSF
jgi:hypothetical protein